MTSAHKIAASITLSLIVVTIAFVLSIVTPALDVHAMAVETGNQNINLPGLTEDRYTGESRNIITLITDEIIPAFLPNTSGSGACGIDVVCDAFGNVTE